MVENRALAIARSAWRRAARAAADAEIQRQQLRELVERLEAEAKQDRAQV